MELIRIVGLALLVGCHRPAPPTASRTASRDGQVTLFRDGVIVRQVIHVDAKVAGPLVVHAEIATSVDPTEVIVTPHLGAITIGAITAALPGSATPATATTDLSIATDVSAPGHYAIELAYATTAIAWKVAYTMTTDAARRSAQLRGAIAIVNASGVDLATSTVEIIDSSIAIWRHAHQGALITSLFGAGHAPAPTMPVPRSLGVAALPRGETRLELLADDPPRAMKSVLVYDPIGESLDNLETKIPIADYELGQHASGRVSESFEIVPPQRSRGDLPSGPMRLLARHPDGTLVVIGEAQLDSSAGAVAVDTIPVGTADGVTAKRTRVELTDDSDHQRLVEEFRIELTNTRPVPVDVVIREHAYRGPAWTVGYASGIPEQAGGRAFTLRTRVPARGTATSFHTIVYTWQPPNQAGKS